MKTVMKTPQHTAYTFLTAFGRWFIKHGLRIKWAWSLRLNNPRFQWYLDILGRSCTVFSVVHYPRRHSFKTFYYRLLNFKVLGYVSPIHYMVHVRCILYLAATTYTQANQITGSSTVSHADGGTIIKCLYWRVKKTEAAAVVVSAPASAPAAVVVLSWCLGEKDV